MSETQDLVTELENLTDFIKKAEDETRDLQEIDLGDLDLKVSQLCEEAKALPADQSVLVQEPMMDMIMALENLAVALQEAQRKTEDEGDT